MKKILPYFICVTLTLCHSVTAVQAQGTTLSVSPPVVEILVAPGKKLVQNFTFKAEGEDLSVIPEIHLVKAQDDLGHVTIDPKPYTPSSISLAITSNYPLGQPVPLKNHEINFRLTFEAASLDVARDTYLALVVRVGSTNELQSASSTLPAISSLILATINPTGVTPIDLDIENFNLPLLHDSYLPLTITPNLKNNSPIMLRPRGIYEVFNSTGKMVFSLPLYPNLVLGQSSRTIRGSLKDLPTNLTWTPFWHNLGPHRLRLTITTEGGTKIVELEKPIWILPIRGIILIVLTLIIILAVFLRLRRHQN